MEPTREVCEEDSAGFTLLEVIVALAILGLSFAVVFGIFSQSIARADANANEGRARTLAQSLLEETRSGPVSGKSGETEDGLIWRIAVAPYGSAEDRAAWSEDLERVTVTVSWQGATQINSVSLMTLRLQAKEHGS